ncbi:hypothetical protein PENTCL1PPCAC_2123, partial [Pristionchus entomophagus]
KCGKMMRDLSTPIERHLAMQPQMVAGNKKYWNNIPIIFNNSFNENIAEVFEREREGAIKLILTEEDKEHLVSKM